MKTKGKPLSIYLHIPFCARKCLYCDFLSAPADDVTKARYVESLITEIKAEAPKYEAYEVRTVFIGGGTPSILPAEAIARIMDTLKEQFCFAKEAEITIEVNPGSAEEEKLLAYYKSGINRLSIGLQSSHNSELQQLGRIHTYQDFLRTYKDAVKSGFNNINVDLMSAIPGQTTESYRETLRQILHLYPMPAHISAYSLIIEEGTPFYENTPELPDEDADREMYKITDDMLKESGLERYEISNYARKGYACKHNKVYWRRGDYVGFGIGAASLIDNVRFHNDDDISAYIAGWEAYKQNTLGKPDILRDVQPLTIPEQMEEYMFLGLRLTEGVSLKEFEDTFGKNIYEVYSDVIDKLVNQGLLIKKIGADGRTERLALSSFGLDVSNVVMAEFLFSDN